MAESAESFQDDDIQQMLVDIAKENGFERPRFEISAATKPGDNYIGRVTRAVIREDGREDLSLIFKTAPLSKVCRDSFSTGLLFTNEGAMYNTILPTLNEFLQEHGIPTEEDTHIYAPRCFRSRISEDWKENALDVLVLEDLSVKGYRTVERSVTLNAEQCRAILHQLALIHAASLGLRKLRPETAEKIESALKDYVKDDMEVLMKGVIPLLESKMSLVEDRYPVGSPEYEKLKNFIDNYSETAKDWFANPKDAVVCITHGDCWSNNVLFTFDKDGKIEDLCLIDFQAARVTSPMADLLYLLFTCTTRKTRDAHFNSFIREYHEDVSSILKAMGCDPESIYPWSKLKTELKFHGRFGLVRALITIPLFTADASEVPANLDSLMEESSGSFTEIFTSVNTSSRLEECKERVSDVLKHCIDEGYI